MNNIGCQKLIDEMTKRLIAFRVIKTENNSKIWRNRYQKTLVRYNKSDLEINHQKNLFLRVAFDKMMADDLVELQNCLDDLLGNPFISYEKFNLRDFEEEKVVLEWVNTEKYDWLQNMMVETNADRDICYYNWQFGQFWHSQMTPNIEEEEVKVKKIKK